MDGRALQHPSPTDTVAGRRRPRGGGRTHAAAALLLALVGCGSATTTGYAASGIVRDATTAKGIAGAAVSVQDGTTAHALVAGADGTFSVPVASATGTVTAQAEGYVGATVPYTLTGSGSHPLVVSLTSARAARRALPPD